jgi:hypothetical protein
MTKPYKMNIPDHFFMTEVDPDGETADIWAHERWLKIQLQNQATSEAQLRRAQERKENAGNPVTRLLATMSVNARTRQVETQNVHVAAARELPLPDYWNK